MTKTINENWDNFIEAIINRCHEAEGKQQGLWPHPVLDLNSV